MKVTPFELIRPGIGALAIVIFLIASSLPLFSETKYQCAFFTGGAVVLTVRFHSIAEFFSLASNGEDLVDNGIKNVGPDPGNIVWAMVLGGAFAWAFLAQFLQLPAWARSFTAIFQCATILYVYLLWVPSDQCNQRTPGIGMSLSELALVIALFVPLLPLPELLPKASEE